MVDLKLPKKRMMVNLAPAWKRAMSFFIDLFIIQFVIILPFGRVMTAKLPMSDNFSKNYEYFNSNSDIIQQLTIIFGLIFSLVFLYFVIFEYKFKQTPGKMFFNLYVEPVDKKETLTLLKVIIRNIAAVPIFPLSLLWIIDPLYMFTSGRRLSDILSKTEVVEEINLYD